MVSEELKKFFSDMTRVEKDYARRLEKTGRRVEHRGLRALIEAVAMDSEKHSMLYKALEEGFGEIEYVTEAEANAIIGEIDYHIKTEAEFIKTLTEKIKSCSDPSIRFVLKTILRDEIYHHVLLENIKKIILEKKKRLDEALWRIIMEELEEKNKELQ